MTVWVVSVYTPYEGRKIVCVKSQRPSSEELKAIHSDPEWNYWEDIDAEPYDVEGELTT